VPTTFDGLVKILPLVILFSVTLCRATTDDSKSTTKGKVYFHPYIEQTQSKKSNLHLNSYPQNKIPPSKYELILTKQDGKYLPVFIFIIQGPSMHSVAVFIVCKDSPRFVQNNYRKRF
jgi:hypothetical protein